MEFKPLPISCIEFDELKVLVTHFGNKSSMQHKKQGFEQFVMDRSYSEEEHVFIKKIETSVPVWFSI